MNCERARLLLDAYSTDELDLAAAIDLEEHLKSCAGCAADLESVRTVRNSISRASLRYTAPPQLREQLASELNSTPARTDATERWRRPRFALAAAVAALVLLPWLAFYFNAHRTSANQLADELTASHIRSLMTDHLLDVRSTDQHTVKPWFNGKLDFSPTVVDLAANGYPLIGGRLDYIRNRPVAALVYQRHKHIINLFTWPTNDAQTAPKLSQHNGYNLVLWTKNGMTAAAVSDVNPQELQEFAQEFTAAR